MKNIFPLGFAKYLSYSEVQKNRKFLDQISASREFVLNLLQKHWFVIVRVKGDQRFVVRKGYC